MKRGIQLLVLFAVLLGLSNCKKAKTDILYSKKYIDEIKEVRKEMGFFLAGNFVPGASIAISLNGELIYSEGIGIASKDLNVPVNRKTKFRIGSVSELYTAYIYHKMVQEGVLNPDSTIQHYYPEFPKKEYPITLDQLVQHSSGIREPNHKETSWRGLNIRLEKGLDNFKNDPLIAQPGYYQYPTSYNYDLLGVVMQKAEKKKFREILKTYLTDTLHLDNTVLDNPVLSIENRSQFYDHNMVSQIINATTLDLRHSTPSNGILSNAEDLVKLGNAYLSSDYLSEETRTKIFTKIQLANGIEPDLTNSWVMLRNNSGGLVYGKDGEVLGGSASILVYPEEKLIIACTTNLTGATGNFPIFKIASKFLPKDESKKETTKE